MGHAHEEKEVKDQPLFGVGPAFMAPARPHPLLCSASDADSSHTSFPHGPYASSDPGMVPTDSAVSLFGGMYDGEPSQSGRADDLTPLTPAAGMAARGEFRGAPLRPSNALRAYADFGAEDFVGGDDIRLEQIRRVAKAENTSLQKQMTDALEKHGITEAEAQVTGRAKTPKSIYGKLLEKPGEQIKNLKDISGARVNINVNQPGYAQHYQVQEALQSELGEGYSLGKNYIKKPNPWGYTGRMHDFYAGRNVPVSEVQIGSADLSNFIDWEAKNASGQPRSMHDLTGYKGELYGTKIAPELEAQYPQLMRAIAENDAAGRTVAQNPELHGQIEGWKGAVQEGLPPRFGAMPAPEVSRWTQLKQFGGKGLGVLGVLGGGLQAWEGAKEIKHDKPVEGTADVAGGLTNAVAGGAMLAGRAALGAGLGGVAAGVDGLKDIYVGARDHDAEKAGLGGVKTAAGGMMLGGAATANPFLIGAGALTYGGALVYEHREALKKLASQGGHWLGTKASDAWAGAKNLGHHVADWF